MGIGQHWWTLICRRGVAKDIVAPQVSVELCKLCSLCTIFFMRIIVTYLNKVIVLGFLIISICVCFMTPAEAKRLSLTELQLLPLRKISRARPLACSLCFNFKALSDISDISLALLTLVSNSRHHQYSLSLLKFNCRIYLKSLYRKHAI